MADSNATARAEMKLGGFVTWTITKEQLTDYGIIVQH